MTLVLMLGSGTLIWPKWVGNQSNNKRKGILHNDFDPLIIRQSQMHNKLAKSAFMTVRRPPVCNLIDSISKESWISAGGKADK